MNIETMIATTISDRITSHLFQLARLAALSSAIVVANVNPLICSSFGLGASRLTVTIITLEGNAAPYNCTLSPGI